MRSLRSHRNETNRSGAAQALRPAARRTVAMATSVICGLLGWGASTVHAESLMDLYKAAQSYDAAYLSAQSQAQATQAQVEQAYALNRPTLGLTAGINRTWLRPAKPDVSSDVGTAEQQVQAASLLQATANTTANTKRVALQGKYALYNPANSAKINQAEQQLQLVQADLKIAEDDLTARLAKAYFDVLGAQDVLTTSQANKKALSEQLASAKRNFEVGNATITDTREAQARFDLAGAQEIAAVNDLRVKRIALDTLVGRNDVQPSPLRTPVNLEVLAPGAMEDWVTQSADAPSIQKANIGLAVAKLEIDKAKAGNLPTVDAVASASHSNIDTSNANYKISAGAGTTYLAGIELNLPLYAGGAIQNRIKEVLTLQDKAERDRDNAQRTVALTTRQAFTAVQSGIAQAKAYEAAESSAKLALEATQLGYRVGVRINKDVLDAQTLLANTQKDLFKARYDVIVASVKLKQAAGALKAEDLDELNRLLVQP